MQYPELPRSSGAEFRLAAHEHYEIPYIIAPPYLPRIGLRGLVGGLFLVFGSVGVQALIDPGPSRPGTLVAVLFVVIFGGGGLALIVSKIRSRRRMRQLNTYLVNGSKEMDALYERGEIPLTPPDPALVGGAGSRLAEQSAYRLEIACAKPSCSASRARWARWEGIGRPCFFIVCAQSRPAR